MSSARRRVAVVAAATTAAVVVAAPAFAGIKATVTRSAVSVTTASWGAAGATTTGTPTTGQAFVITWSSPLLGTSSQYFQVVNTGTLDLTGETYAATNAGSNVTVTLTACVGATWNASTGKCGGTQVVLDTSGGSSTTASTPIPASSALSVRAQASGLSLTSFTTSVTVTTTRSEVRAATTINS
jgi:hypothetical protein